MKDAQSFLHNRNQGAPIPVDIRIGRAEAAIPCESCKNIRPSGFFVFVKGGNPLLICMHCCVSAIFKHQELNPFEKLFDVDLNAHPEDYKKAADAVRAKMPELSESKAMELAEAAINAI